MTQTTANANANSPAVPHTLDGDPVGQSHCDRDLAPALLFPSDATVPKPASKSVDNFWGRTGIGAIEAEGRTVSLYPDEDWGDAVLFVDGGGGDT
jgi:hypothetical protein